MTDRVLNVDVKGQIPAVYVYVGILVGTTGLGYLALRNKRFLAKFFSPLCQCGHSRMNHSDHDLSCNPGMCACQSYRAVGKKYVPRNVSAWGQ